MTRYLFVILIVVLGRQSHVSSQTLLKPIDKNYEAKVKLVDEFFDRFNGWEYTPYINKELPNYKKQNLLSLFNIEMFKSRNSPLYMQADSLIDFVLDNNVHLNFSDSLWFAKAQCLAKMNGQETDLTIWLNVEKRDSVMLKWVIARVEGEVLKMKPSNSKHDIILFPNDHETNFISLHRLTKDYPKQSLQVARKSFEIDETSVFFTLVNLGVLKIESVTDLEFIFLQIPGYRFRIRYFERENANCGWLISSFEKIAENDETTVKIVSE